MTSKFVAAAYAAAGAGTGDTTGAASSTDNAIARFDGAGGKTIQNSTVTVSDTGGISGASLTGYRVAFAAKAANYTLTLADYAITIDATLDDREITLPAASTAFANGAGQVYLVMRIDSGFTATSVQILTTGLDTITGGSTLNIEAGVGVFIIATSTSTWWTV